MLFIFCNCMQIDVLPDIMLKPKLEVVHLQFNKLHGELTAAMKALSSRKTASILHQVDLSHNQLYGAVPKELSRLGVFHKLGAPPSTPRYLNLAANNFEGEVPQELHRIDFTADVQVLPRPLVGSTGEESSTGGIMLRHAAACAFLACERRHHAASCCCMRLSRL
jgi:hypothetical protein